VRNRGTIGGSIAHADPASDVPALALALDYSAVLRSSRGERVVPLDGFFQGAFVTDMAPDEILMSIRRGPLPAGVHGSYQKMAHPASGYSIVGVCAVIGSSGGSISHARVAITGVGEVAYRAKGVEAALMGSDGSRMPWQRLPRTRPRVRPSPVTSTPTAPIDRRWPRCTRAAPSMPPSGGSAPHPSVWRCASSGSPQVDVPPPGSPAPS
jgi:hypothetical protein